LVQRVRKVNTLFLLTVALPVTLATIYYGFIASDIYVSESRFVVRSQQRQASTGFLGSLLEGSGMGRAQDEAYSVQDYILSRDALHQLDLRLEVRKAFSDKNVDLLSRFPGLEWDDSFEALYRYYPKRVVVAYDPTSAIATLKVTAFNANDARRINEQLLSMSEALVNQLNKRALEDSIRFATGVVEDAERKTKAAALAMAAFRTRSSIFDPERQSTLQLQGVAKLQEELIATKTQLAQVRGLSASNPQIAVLERRVVNLQSEIDAETRKVAGGGGGSLSSRATEYARLELERGFAEKQLASALASLELARNEGQKKQLYLERIVQPSLPDYPGEPRRIRSILIVLVLGLMAWGVLSLLLASVREHQD
jgi:capsular polysaccharide transport system permease protein